MENSYHQTTRRNFLNQLGLAAAGMTTGNTALATTQYDSGIPRNSVPDRTSDNSAKRVIMISKGACALFKRNDVTGSFFSGYAGCDALRHVT